MCSKNIFFTLGFWVGLPQNLGFDFSVQDLCGALDKMITLLYPLNKALIHIQRDESKGELASRLQACLSLAGLICRGLASARKQYGGHEPFVSRNECVLKSGRAEGLTLIEYNKSSIISVRPRLHPSQ